MSGSFESVGIGFGGDPPVEALADLAVLADQSDLRSLWIQENDKRSTIALAAAVLHATRRIMVGTGITSPFRRHPQTLAIETATLNELSNNRFILGLGASERLIRAYQMHAKPIEAMVDAFAIIRGIYAWDDFTYDGSVFAVATPQTRLTPRPRIYMGALGPRMLGLAGELADGVILSRRATFSPKYTKFAIDEVAKTARHAGRDSSRIDSVGFFETCLAKDRDEARQFAKRILGTYTIPGTPQSVLDMEGISEADVAKVKSNYLKGDLDAAVSGVTDDLVDKFALAGTPDECLEKLRTYPGTGLKCPILYIHGPNLRIATQLAAEKIAPFLVSEQRD
jgi:5,10-methylenetetrahydromethanopterin reductase